MPIDPITKNDMSQVTIKTSIELKDAEKKCLFTNITVQKNHMFEMLRFFLQRKHFKTETRRI